MDKKEQKKYVRSFRKSIRKDKVCMLKGRKVWVSKAKVGVRNVASTMFFRASN